jgi:hypothetical protein
MPTDFEARWHQRVQSFHKGFVNVSEGAQLASERELSPLEKQGLIQTFAFTHELAWNVLTDCLECQGIRGVIGSRGATREAFKNGPIADGEVWMDIRNQTRHPLQRGNGERDHPRPSSRGIASKACNTRRVVPGCGGGVMNGHGLRWRTVEQFQDVLARHPEVGRAVLFKSLAKGTARPGFDIDLTLYGAGLNWRVVGRIEETTAVSA